MRCVFRAHVLVVVLLIFLSAGADDVRFDVELKGGVFVFFNM